VISVLGDDAFKPEPAGVVEDGLAVALDMLVELDAGRRLCEQPFEPRPAHMQGLRPEVLAIEFQSVEGIEQDPVIVLPAVHVFEDRDAVGVATDRLAVDRGRAGRERRHALGYERVAVSPIVAVKRRPRPACFRAISR
jgi:hypothetical protein